MMIIIKKKDLFFGDAHIIGDVGKDGGLPSEPHLLPPHKTDAPSFFPEFTNSITLVNCSSLTLKKKMSRNNEMFESLFNSKNYLL